MGRRGEGRGGKEEGEPGQGQRGEEEKEREILRIEALPFPFRERGDPTST